MKLFFACTPSKEYVNALTKKEAKNILISFAYFKHPKMYEQLSNGTYPESLLIDSGAFSVWTKGDKIDIDKYIEYCKEIKKLKSDANFVNLDVLPGRFGKTPTQEEREESARQGWENMCYIENKGVKVIPVFHQHEDFRWLKNMMAHTDYIGISPANDVTGKQKGEWLRQVFDIMKQHRKTHCFGATSFNILSTFPFYSADSSSWTAGARFARLNNFSGGKSKSFGFKNKKDFLKNWDKIKTKDLGLLEDYKIRISHGIDAFQELEKFINSVWLKRGIKWN